MKGLGNGRHGQRKATITLRFAPELIEELRAASEAHPYGVSITQIVERGCRLALSELGRSGDGVKVRLDTLRFEGEEINRWGEKLSLRWPPRPPEAPAD
jgi:hypothetical protein